MCMKFGPRTNLDSSITKLDIVIGPELSVSVCVPITINYSPTCWPVGANSSANTNTLASTFHPPHGPRCAGRGATSNQ